MPSNVLQFPTRPRWGVLVVHQPGTVRHMLRTLIETEHIAVVAVADGEAALAALACERFDLLILELDLPQRAPSLSGEYWSRHANASRDSLLAHQEIRGAPPASFFRWRQKWAASLH